MLGRIKLLLINYYLANSISSYGSASLAAVTSEARQTESCEADFVCGQSSAGEGTQPSGYERLQTKKNTNSFGGLRNILPGRREGVYSSL